MPSQVVTAGGVVVRPGAVAGVAQDRDPPSSPSEHQSCSLLHSGWTANVPFEVTTLESL